MNTVTSISVNSLSYMPDDVLKNLGFISLVNDNYQDNAHIGNSIIFQVDKNDNLSWTEDINNFLIKKLQLKLNPKKEFNLVKLNNYHLKVLSNNLKISHKNNNYRYLKKI